MKIKFLQNWFTHTRRNGWCTLARSEGIDNLHIGFTRYSDFIIPFSDASRKSISEVPHQNIYRCDNETRVFEKSVYLGLTHESTPRPGLWFCHALVQSGLEVFWPAAVFINEDHFKKDFPPEEDTILFTQTIPEKYIEFVNWGEYFNNQSSTIKNIYDSSLIDIVNRIVLKGDDISYTFFVKSNDIEYTGNIILLLNLMFPKKLAVRLTFINYYLFPEKIISGPFRIVGLIPQCENPVNWNSDKTDFGYFDLLDKDADVLPDIYSKQITEWIQTNESEKIISFFEWLEKNSLDTSFSVLPQCVALYSVITDHLEITWTSYKEITSVFENNRVLVKRLLWSELRQADVAFLEEILLSEILNTEFLNEFIIKEVLDFAGENALLPKFYFMSLDKLLQKYSAYLHDKAIELVSLFPLGLHDELREQIIMHFKDKNPDLFMNLFLSEVKEKKSWEFFSKSVGSLKINESLVKRILDESAVLTDLPHLFWIKVYKELSANKFPPNLLFMLSARVLKELFLLAADELDELIDEKFPELTKRFFESETREIIHGLYRKLDEKIRNTLSEFGLQSKYDDYLYHYIQISKYGRELCLVLSVNGVNNILIKSHIKELFINLTDDEFKAICENFQSFAKDYETIAEIITELLPEKRAPGFSIVFISNNFELIPCPRIKQILERVENDLFSGSVCGKILKPDRLLNAFKENQINPLHYPFILHELLINEPVSEFKILAIPDVDRSLKEAIQDRLTLFHGEKKDCILTKTLSNYCKILHLKANSDAEISSRIADIFLNFCLDPERNSWLKLPDKRIIEIFCIISGYIEKNYPGYFLYSIVRSHRYDQWVGNLKRSILGDQYNEAKLISLLLKKVDRLHAKRWMAAGLVNVLIDFDLTQVLTIKEAKKLYDQKSNEISRYLIIPEKINQRFPHSCNGITDELNSIIKYITDYE